MQILTIILLILLLTACAGLLTLFVLRRAAEAKKRLYQDALDNSTQAICITDGSGSIEYVNDAYCSVTGYGRDELIGKNPKIMKSDRHDASFYRGMWTELKEKGRWDGEIWDRRKGGEIYPKWLVIKAFRMAGGLKYIGIFSDISTIKQTEEYIEHVTHHDGLTGLPNRLLFRERLRQALADAGRSRGLVAVISLDIDQFKKINSGLGYQAGDQLLSDVARRLAAFVGEKGTIARMGGDEFWIILHDHGDRTEVLHTVQSVADSFSEKIILKGRYDVVISVVMGISFYPSDGHDVDTLMKNADTARSSAKEKGVKFALFSPEMTDRSYETLSIEANIRNAFERQEFLLYYQPLGDMISGAIIGAEALIRRKESDWIAPPGKFIVVAEKAGLISPICEWSLKAACRDAVRWNRDGLPPMRISVNVAAPQFHHRSIVKSVKEALDGSGLPPWQIELELTERMIMSDMQASIRMMQELREMGLRLSIDDFGTGYSSLSYLKKFPINKLKIDISFVRDIPHDPDSVAIAKAIIGLAHTLNLRVIAEGIETEKQFEFFKEHGCDEIQGYYFSIPLPEAAFRKALSEGRHL